ncbi:MAG: low temperature requirement protein A, partial [Actinomycetota bacterium]
MPSRVSWFELFYDLVIVASFAHTGHLIVSDLSGDRLTTSLGVWLVSTFIITFVLWFATSTAVNIAPGDVTL